MSRPTFKNRLSDIQRLYDLLADLEERLGGKRMLAESEKSLGWPKRGVYFFFEPGEVRTTSGSGPRVVRVGTHALKSGSRSTLWKRLRQHRGTLSGKYPGGGNHRGSIFRLHVGTALIEKHDLSSQATETWGSGSSAGTAIRKSEYPLEKAVSQYIRSMPFLWIAVEDEAGPGSLRGEIERNTIALLSNYNADRPIDPPRENWLGRWATNEAIERSGLWNVNHVADQYDPGFLRELSVAVSDFGYLGC